MNKQKFRSLAASALAAVVMAVPAMAATPTGINPAVDITKPNFANSPNLRKFVDSLPGLGSANQNNLGQYIPVGNPDTTTFPGSDYYEIGLQDYQQRMHSDLPAPGTKLRGYNQINSGTVGPTDTANQYLGPLIIAKRDRPVRLKFVNQLGINGAGNLFLPVDTTVMGAGMGPLDMPGMPGMKESYTQNRATIHLHGGLTPWISDGTPHQWITPAGDNTSYKKGLSFQNVPDMVGPGTSIPTPAPNDGIGTFYYPNQQSARLMFYHDHAYGITRLNVYAGEAAGYLLTDQTEEDLISGTNVSGVFGTGTPRQILPNLGGTYRYGIPLIIQDKSFINESSTPPAGFPATATPTPLTSVVDPLWYNYVPGSPQSSHGNLWLPHEYLPNENIYNASGFNVMGRWDYAPWMIPPMQVLNNTLPSPTIVPEAFMDTAVVNGTAFPFLELPPTAVRFRILNACNDRMLNLQLYKADPANPTEVKMVPASPNPAFPTWPKDGRDGGVPDPTTAGPNMIQIGNEAGFLAKVAIVPPQPVDFDYNRRSVTFGGVTSKSLYLPPAVRADVIVDLSSYKDGDTLILYNDAPAPMPLFDSRYDYFTDDPDQTAIGGAPSTPAGFGPNVRTIMQIRIKGAASAPFDLPALEATLPKAFATSQDRILVPAAAYGPAYGTTYQNIFANSVDETLNVTGTPQPVAKVMVELPGFGYTTPPQVSFFGGGGTGAAATATLNGVTGITLVTPGSGCTTAPTVNIAPVAGGGGTGAAASAIISGGVVTTVAITNPGSNYLLAPNVTFTGGCTVAPTAVANVTLGSVGTINLTNAGSGYTSAPRVYLTGGGGTGAMAAAMLNGSMILNGKNLVEGFDMEFGRMNAVLGSTPNPLAPTVGAGPVIGAAFYVDPPTEILKAGETVLWRLNHLGVDSHAIHFHLFNVQVVNRVDWTNTVKPPYDDELGWKETIRTNPFEDIIVAIRPVAMDLPFALPDSNRLLDVTTPAGSTTAFQPVLPPPGLPAVAQISNVMTNFGWEYVWHCHLLGHEENDMMRPIVFQPGAAVATVSPTSLPFGNQQLNTASAARTITLSNSAAPGVQSLIISGITVTGANATDFAQTNNCGPSLASGKSCTISVIFTPSATGLRNASLTIASSDPARPTVNAALSGTGLNVPAVPTNLTAAITGATQVTLSWIDASNNETSFGVWRSVNGAAATQIATVTRTAAQSTATGGTVTYINTGLTAGTIYAYYVTAINALGSSAASNTATVNFSGPSAPTGLTATRSPATQVVLNWTDTSDNESSFSIQRATNAAFSAGLTTFTAAANATTFTNTVPSATATYYFRVRAVNPVGNSAWVTVGPVAPAPPVTVTAVSPAIGTTAGGTVVTLTGTNFVTGATVSFGGTAATAVTVVSSTSITATTPAHAIGLVAVTVTNTDSSTGTLANGFTYTATPTVTAVAPNSGSTAGGTAVTITGTNFVAGATVSFGGTAATAVTVVSSTSITATTPAHALGAVAVTVTNPGNLSATLANGFTYVTVAPVTYTLFPATAVPVVAAEQDAAAVELGMKFSSTTAGRVTGVRFYKSTANSGTHVGSLWSNTGTLLGQVTFTGESPSGWQQMNFPTPIAITPNTTYVISYHTNTGFYADDLNYFTTARTNGPLTAPAETATNPNGVYRYSATPSFPNSGYLSSNYWVDVVLTVP